MTVAGRPEWIARGQEGRVEHASQADNQDGSGTIKIGQLHGSEWPSAGNGAVNGQKKDRQTDRQTGVVRGVSTGMVKEKCTMSFFLPSKGNFRMLLSLLCCW